MDAALRCCGAECEPPAKGVGATRATMLECRYKGQSTLREDFSAAFDASGVSWLPLSITLVVALACMTLFTWTVDTFVAGHEDLTHWVDLFRGLSLHSVVREKLPPSTFFSGEAMWHLALGLISTELVILLLLVKLYQCLNRNRRLNDRGGLLADEIRDNPERDAQWLAVQQAAVASKTSEEILELERRPVAAWREGAWTNQPDDPRSMH